MAASADSLHPWAWWLWALGAAAAASLTTNPLTLLLLVLAVSAVVLLRRSDAPWARSLRAYFVLAGFVLGIRLTFAVLMGLPMGTHVLFSLPEIPLPEWAAGIRLGGDVTLEGLLFTLYDSLRLAAMLVCLGAANALANPRRALRSVPAALYEASVAIVIALSVAPQLVASGQRVMRARRLRGSNERGLRALPSVVIPVLADAVERSMALATSMEARGFGHSRRPGTGPLVLVVAAMASLTLGTYLVLGSPAAGLGTGCLAVGAVGAVTGLRASGKALTVTRYRPNVWSWQAWLVGASGLAAAGCVLATSWGLAHPSTDPPEWPALAPLSLVAAALLAAPLLLTTREPA